MGPQIKYTPNIIILDLKNGLGVCQCGQGKSFGVDGRKGWAVMSTTGDNEDVIEGPKEICSSGINALGNYATRLCSSVGVL